MQIPDQFQLGGITVTVVTNNTLAEERKCIGEARYSKQEIMIDKTAAPAQLTQQSFLHEVTHWILYMMNEEELRNNEKFVDNFAHYWYQYETSKLNEPKPSQDDTTQM